MEESDIMVTLVLIVLRMYSHTAHSVGRLSVINVLVVISNPGRHIAHFKPYRSVTLNNFLKHFPYVLLTCYAVRCCQDIVSVEDGATAEMFGYIQTDFCVGLE